MNLKHSITVENMKCGGCTSTILQRIGALASVESVEVEADTVSFFAPSATVDTVRETLRTLGYPERGSASGVAAITASARSFVSCAVGKMGVAS